MINTTMLTNGSGNILIDTMVAVNTASRGIFGLMLVLSIYIIIYIMLARYGTKVALSTTSFIVTIVALLLTTMNIITNEVFLFCVVILIISVLVSYNSER